MTDCCRTPLKRRYTRKITAEATLRMMVKQFGARDLHVYWCPAGHYHVGHDPVRVKWRRMRGRRAVR